MIRCDQTTRRGEQCMREATWTMNTGSPDDYWSSGIREGYCTQHANEYDPGFRGRKLKQRWQPVGKKWAVLSKVRGPGAFRSPREGGTIEDRVAR